MGGYRIYRLDCACNIELPEWVEAADDEEAVRRASDLSKRARRCEVWRGRRLVAALEGQRLTA